ncbi:hypothetical protein SH661x_004366 [Planctomicrobium sp. SH661]|uniref:hypothetical protein n=1 Tax=Planctomicrobium sp. SH661 TaxID=3448124 RepID=UPI003F5C3223
MPDLLSQGSAWLEQQRTRHLATSVTYVRGETSIDVLATIGRTKFETDDGHTVRIEFTDRDFLILVADLMFAGQATEPERGDLIHEGDREFEVLDWRYSDPYRQTFRITTKQA